MHRIYISVSNDLVTDQRVQRVASMFFDRGMDVCCIGRKCRNNLPTVMTGYRLRRLKMLFHKGPLFYACFNLRLFLVLLFVPRPSLFIANDLDTLAANYLASRIRNVTLLYDSHELFTEVPELVHRHRIQAIWQGLEARILPKLKYAVTVSPSIAEFYLEKYETPFTVVRNVPERLEYPLEDKGKPEKTDTPYLIYQGALNLGRGLELMISSMEFMSNAKLLIAGTGDVEEDLKAMVRQKGLEEKVIFTGRVSPGELPALTSRASLGLSLEEDLGLNYRYALPNKLFDYVQCRIPVITSDLPEMKQVVEAYGIGRILYERDAKVLARIMQEVMEESSKGKWSSGLEKAAADLSWDKEKKKYLEVLEDLNFSI